MDKIQYVGQLIKFCGEPYIITNIYFDYDPYLWYCKHYIAYSLSTGKITGAAIATPENRNPYCDIDGVLNGTKQSKYA